MTSPGLSYIVPAFNEEGAIVATVERLRVVLAGLGLPYEIIIVDDGSRDRTREQVESLGFVRVVRHAVNIGYGSAIKSGIKAAKHDWIGIVDADGTYDIESLPRLVEKMREGYDMVVGARANVSELDSLAKKFFRQTLIGFLNLVVAGRIEDPNSGFRIFTKEMALFFFPFLCHTFSFTTSLTVFAFGERFFVSYVSVNYGSRTGKSKVHHFRDSLRMIQLVLQGITFFNPVKFYLMLSIALIAGVLAPSLVILAAGFASFAAYWFATGAIVCLLVGLGVLGDIVRISGIRRSDDFR